MRIIGILIAAVVAIAATYLAYNILSDGNNVNQPIVAQTKEPDIPTVQVLVAARNIELGEVLDSTTVASKEWPQHLVLDGFISSAEDSKLVIGRVARTAFMTDEPINMNRLSAPDDPNFMAARLGEGMRMITISSDNIAGLAGFVYPGDRVDLIVTRKHALPAEVSESTGLRDTSVTETLVPNIKVLAVNQRASISPSNAANSQAERRERIPNSISLEVSLEDAQKLRLAQETGYVSLILRSLDDKNTETDPIVITESDITRADELGYVMTAQSTKDEMESSDTVSVVRGIQKVETQVPSLKEEIDEDKEETDDTIYDTYE